MQTNYIYLLQEREFIRTNEKVYKIGQTTQLNNKRLKQYPNGSVLLFQIICKDCKNLEKIILRTFNKNSYIIQRKEYGNEYFQGDYKKMIDIIYKIFLEEENTDISLDSDSDDSFEYKTIYKDWLNETGMKIIITNKKTAEGYLKWRQEGLWDHSYDCLSDISSCAHGINDICPSDIYSSADDSDLLDKNIIETCYTKNVKLYQLKYNEYLLPILFYPYERGFKYYILETTKFILYEIEDVVKTEILVYNGFDANILYIKNIDNIRINIIDDILDKMIDIPVKLQYKQLMYNILVKQVKTIIFYDCKRNGWLRSWIINVSYKLSIEYLDSPDYYKNKREGKKFIKNNKPRFVIVSKEKLQPSIEKQIDEFTKLGFKNIIVTVDNTDKRVQNRYKLSMDSFEEYLKENVLNYVKDEYDCDRSVIWIDEVFFCGNLLLTNFIKWCCTPDTTYV